MKESKTKQIIPSLVKLEKTKGKHINKYIIVNSNRHDTEIVNNIGDREKQ